VVITLTTEIRTDDTFTHVTTTRSIARTCITANATPGFQPVITKEHALLSKAIIHGKTKDATTIPIRAQDIQGEDSATTDITAAGRSRSVMRQTATTIAPTEDVTCLTFTAHSSFIPTENVTPTHPGRMTAVRADCLTVSCTLEDATTARKTARRHFFLPVMANAMKIGPQSVRKPIAIPYQEQLSTITVCAISRLGNVLLDIMSTANVTVTGYRCTLLPRVKTLADTTPKACAIIIPAIVDTIRLTVSAIGDPVGLH